MVRWKIVVPFGLVVILLFIGMFKGRVLDRRVADWKVKRHVAQVRDEIRRNIALLKDSDPQVRVAAVRVLGYHFCRPTGPSVDEDELFAEIALMLRDEDASVRSAALESLVRPPWWVCLRARPDPKLIALLFQDGDARLRRAARQALRHFGIDPDKVTAR